MAIYRFLTKSYPSHFARVRAILLAYVKSVPNWLGGVLGVSGNVLGCVEGCFGGWRVVPGVLEYARVARGCMIPFWNG